jgi:tetratricopeptide (TPR) repeat protein
VGTFFLSSACNRKGWWPRTGLSIYLLVLLRLTCAWDVYGAERHEEFLRALREDGYPDVALEYTRRLQQRRATLPAEFAERLDLQLASVLVEASQFEPPERAEALLDEAARLLERFVSTRASSDDSFEARYQLGLLWLARARQWASPGSRQVLSPGTAHKAREAFAQARAAFEALAADLERLVTAHPAAGRPATKSKEPLRPRTSARRLDDRQEKLRGLYQMAHLYHGMTYYYEALVYPSDNRHREELLRGAIGIFDTLFQRYRLSLTVAALYAHLWHGRCLHELGQYRDAIDIYDEVLVTEPPAAASLSPRDADLYVEAYLSRLRAMEALQQYQQILQDPVYAAPVWLRSHAAWRRHEGYLGVQMVLVRALLRQAESEKDPGISGRYLREALQWLDGDLSRRASPYQQEALQLRNVVAWRVRGRDAHPQTWDEAVALGEMAFQKQQWQEASQWYEKAFQLARMPTDPLQVAAVRYRLAYAYLQRKSYERAWFHAESLLREAPQSPLTSDAATVALLARYEAWRRAAGPQRDELQRALQELAQQLQRRWPEQRPGNLARRIEGLVLWSQGRFEEAAQALAAVPPGDPDYADCQLRAGQALWSAYRQRPLRDRTDSSTQNALAHRTLKCLEAALNACAPDQGQLKLEVLTTEAEVLAQLGRPAEAWQAVGEALQLAKSLPTADPAVRAHAVKAHLIGLKVKVQQGDAEELQQLLDRLRQLDAQGKPGSPKHLSPSLATYLVGQIRKQWAGASDPAKQQVGTQLLEKVLAQTDPENVQDAQTLAFWAETYFSIRNYEKAAELYERLLKTIPEQERTRRLPYEVKLAACERERGRFDQALERLEKLLRSLPAPDASSKAAVPVSVMAEQARTLQAWAARDPDRLPEALRAWSQLAELLSQRRPRPREYYEARLGVAWCLSHQGRKEEARQILHVTLQLSPDCGGPDLKQEYEALLQQLK